MSIHRHSRRQAFATAALLGLANALAAADPSTALATWAFGAGTLADRPAALSAPVGPGQAVVAGATPVRLELAGFPGSDVIIGPGGSIALNVERGATADERRLIISLDRGTIQVDVTGTGPYQDLLVRGGALDIRVTGTLFVVERVRRDADYVALVKGKLAVNLRRTVADAATPPEGIELQSRQGLLGSAGGLAAVDQMNNRPQVPVADGAPAGGTQQQGTAPAQGEGGWETDAGGAATGDTPDAPVEPPLVAQVPTPPTPPTPPVVPPPAAPPLDPTDGFLGEVGGAIAESLLIDLAQGGAVVDELIDTINFDLDLGNPPSPPR